MKNLIVLFTLISFTLFGFAQTNPPNLLSEKYSLNELKEILITRSDWIPFPGINDRNAWNKADEEMMKGFLKTAEENIDYDFPAIPATKSLLIARTGDRDEYQLISFQKRTVLGTMLLAEIYENEGRFIDPIINGVWSICEESWWGVPAHLPKSDEYSGLMDVSKPFVDLFAAETATFLSWVDYFLGDKLDEVSPQIRKRIYYETNYRVFQPLMNQHHGWMGYRTDGGRPNNWNPWICSNWLNSILLLEKDDQKRADHVFKILDVIDEFLNPYPQDGGCDEGPGYWGAAAASLFDNLAMLNTATNNKFEYAFKDEKIKNMASFIYKAQISEDYFLNFADADPQPGMAASMIYRFGKAINDDKMVKFGAYYRIPKTGEISRFQYFRNLYEVFLRDEMDKTEQVLPLLKDSWYPDLKVMISRDIEGSTDGFFIAAKGGHNAESHNHNDIGNYAVYYNGLPLLIDVGRGSYTLRTFSDGRYDIWFNRSDYHNVPTINGLTQLPGSSYKATNVDYKKTDINVQLSLDISKAYPKEAKVNSWQRTIVLNRGKNVQVKDVINLESAESITQHLVTCYPAEVKKEGELLIHFKGQDFVVKYNPKQMVPNIEKVKLESMEDQGILKKWGDTIYRINFEVKKPKTKDQFTFTVSKMN